MDMPITNLAPEATLVVVDVQSGTLPNSRAIPADQLVDRIAALAAAFRSTGRPVVFTVSTGTPAGRTTHGPGGRTWPAGFSDLDERLGRTDDEPLLSRLGWSAFAGTELAGDLRARGVREVVIVGLATTFGVESTARAAYDLGFDVIVVTDAISDPDPAGHERSVARVLPVLGRVLTAEELQRLVS
jgi:nicotinamidase-related amidase